MRFLIRVMLSLIYALLAQALFAFLRDVQQELKKRREANLKEATLNNVIPINRRKIYPCSESWPKYRDPTHGQIDWDIQWHVENYMQCRDHNQAFVIGLTLQEKRNRGREVFIHKPDMEQATETKPMQIVQHHVSMETGRDILKSISEYERRRTGRNRYR